MISGIKKVFGFLPAKSFIFVVIASIISAVLFAHFYDVSVLAIWWRTLLDCISEGNFSQYQHVLASMNLETNYPLFLNIVASVWILPLHIILNIFHLESHLWIYILWIKVLLIISNLGIAKAMQGILESSGVSKERQINVSLIYLLSPFVQFYSIGMGQIDAFGLLFAMLCFLSLQKGSRTGFVIYAVVSILLKPFVVFIIVPLLIYAWFKDKKLSIICAVSVVAVYFVHNLLSDVLIQDYSRGSKFWNMFVFYPRLMEWTVLGIPLVIILIALVCLFFLIWGIFRPFGVFHVLLCQTVLLVIFEALIRQHPQWFIYFAVSAVMLMAFCNRSKIAFLLFIILEIVYCLCGIVFFDEGNIITSYSDAGLIGKILDYNGFNAGEYFGSLMPDISAITITLLSVMSLVYVIGAILLHRSYDNKKEDEITHPLLSAIIAYIPSLALSAFVTVGYII
ncbi:MAG: hypothetical protein E7279_02575 [Lachnospiraceae bacterium]|nr:hypothetical protein [Lachnospiraceae bacterium]